MQLSGGRGCTLLLLLCLLQLNGGAAAEDSDSEHFYKTRTPQRSFRHTGDETLLRLSTGVTGPSKVHTN